MEYNSCFTSKDSCLIGARLIDILGKLGCKLSLVEASERFFIRSETSPKVPLIMTPITLDKFYDLAKRRHGLDLKPQADIGKVFARSFQDVNDSAKQPDWFIEPLCRKGELVLLAAEAGEGKTLVATTLGFLVAGGEPICSRLVATETNVVLYIDAELPGNRFTARHNPLRANFSNQELARNFMYISMVDIGKKLDLSMSEDQEWVTKEVLSSGAKFLVLDNLVGFLPFGADKNPGIWGKASKYLRSLNGRGITVLLVHHLNKDKSFSGTSRIKFDSDVFIALKRPKGCSDDQTRVELHFVKARYLHDDEKTIFELEFVTANGATRVIAKDLKGNDISQPTVVVSQDDIDRHGHSPIQVEVLNEALRAGVRGVTKRQFVNEDEVGKGNTNIKENLRELCDQKFLIKAGAGKSARYYIPENQPQAADSGE